MYKLIRNIHLILGMASVCFVLLYTVSAAQMAHQIRLTPTVAEEDWLAVSARVSLAAGCAAFLLLYWLER